MVKFRGIEICMISQFDICRLPEFQYPSPEPYQQPADPFQVHGHDSRDREEPAAAISPICPTASCYVPVYPGSQIWFEYTIDGPHPPGAAYFFKMFVNNKAVTAWDCTAKHGFHGKMMYNLVVGVVKGDGGFKAVSGESENVVRRQALRFGGGLSERTRQDALKFGDGAIGRLQDDMIQISVHRIEHRKRIRDLQRGVGLVDINSNHADGLRLTDSGLLEPGFRPRRYQYQLVDPVDLPYAAFRFYCRPSEYLEDRGVVRLRECTSPCSTMSSTLSQTSTERSPHSFARDTHQPFDSAGSPMASSPPQPITTLSPVMVRDVQVRGEMNTTMRALARLGHITLSDSDDSLSVKTKDSIEELPSPVPRSPKSSHLVEKKSSEGQRQREAQIPPSPTRSPRAARHRLKKKLTVNISGAEFDVERKRPLSPFTSGRMLRKACVLPQTAPPAVTEFGPTVEDEVGTATNIVRAEHEFKAGYRTTSAERGGKRLMGFLGRRINKDKS